MSTDMGQLVLRSSKLGGGELLDNANARIDELRFLRQERAAIIRAFTKDGFRKPYDSEPLSAYVNSFVAAQMRSVRDALEGNDRR